MTDTLQKFLFEHTPVRGEFVELSDTWQQAKSRHNYPAAVQNLLGEMMAAAALLSANLKFNGSIIMQIHGDGPVKLLVVECDADLRLRATAKLREHAEIPDHADLQQLVHQHGQGRFVITLDPHEKLPGQQAYQGIVPLNGDTIASVIESYMLRSEQLDTLIWLAADDKVARGMLLQKLPDHGGNLNPAHESQNQTIDWQHLQMLGNTLKREELLSADIATLQRRLFWEQDLRVFEPLSLSFYCSCSREKVANMLNMLGHEEIAAALSEREEIEIQCDFCGKEYRFDAVDCASLFLNPAQDPQSGNQTRH